MTHATHLTHTSALILQAVSAGYSYGFDVMNATGLPSGTVYPALRRLEQAGFVRSRWEKEQKAHREQRPARKYYEISRPGRHALSGALKRYQHLERALPPIDATPRPSRVIHTMSAQS